MLNFSQFAHWRQAHATSLAAWCIATLPVSDPRRDTAALWLDDVYSAGLSRLVKGLPKSESDEVDDENPIVQLPQYSLRMLGSIANARSSLPTSIEKLPDVSIALWEARNRPRRAGGHPYASRARAVRVVAFNICEGHGSAYAFPHLAGRLINKEWRKVAQCSECVEALRLAFDKLRARSENAASKFQALIILRKALRESSNNGANWALLDWERVEFEITNRLFSWPLLAANQRNGDESVGLSLPILLDATLSGRVDVTGGGRRLVQDWDEPAQKARDAALDLWLKETGHYGVAWRESVRDSFGVKIDLSAACSIIDEIAGGGGEDDTFYFEIEGRSLELPLALAAFSQIRGVRPSTLVGSTGMISDAPVDDDAGLGLDRMLQLPRGLVDKIRWADASAVFDKIIVPRASENDGEDFSEEVADKDELNVYLESGRGPRLHRTQLNFCTRLSVAADASFYGEWRRHRFARCVDLAPLLLQDASAFSATAMEIIELFSQSSNSIGVDLGGLDVIKICGALGWINSIGREQLPFEDGMPPKISVGVVRVFEDDTPEQFIRLISELCGAPNDLIASICASATQEGRAARLSGLINKTMPDASKANWRPPDLLIISVPPAILQKWKTNKSDRSSGSVCQVLDLVLALEPSIRTVVDHRWGTVFGAYRLLIAVDRSAERVSSSEGAQFVELPGGSTNDAEALEQLSIFRSPFSLQEAVALLESRQVSATRALLSRLEQIGYLGGFAGRWWITIKGRRANASGAMTNARLVLLHSKAAAARAPYLLHERGAGLSDVEACSFEMMQEARWHILSALECRASEELQSTLQYWLVSLALYWELPGWELLYQAGGDIAFTRGDTAAELVTQHGLRLLRNSHAAGENVMPVLAPFLWVLEKRKDSIAAGFHSRFAAERSSDWLALTKLGLECVEKYGGLDLDASDLKLPDLMAPSNDATYIPALARVLFQIVSRPHRLSRAKRELIDGWISEFVAAKEQNALFISAAWHEQRGEGEVSEKCALAWYEKGIKASPFYMQNWLKAIGCFRAAEADKADVFCEELRALSNEHVEDWRRVSLFLKGLKVSELRKNARLARGYYYLQDLDLVQR